MGKPYLPLMMGDWVRGTRGMRSDVKGVYIGLLIHQYDHGSIPESLEDLALIEPEVGKVWDTLKHKFKLVAPGKLQNEKLEEVRAFWNKQGKNAKKGGRPKKEKPKVNPKVIPTDNPNPILHNEHDLDNELKINSALDESFIEPLRMKWKHVDFERELDSFKDKVRGSPSDYQEHGTSGIRNAFLYQLRNARTTNQKPSSRTSSFSGTGYGDKF